MANKAVVCIFFNSLEYEQDIILECFIFASKVDFSSFEEGSEDVPGVQGYGGRDRRSH